MLMQNIKNKQKEFKISQRRIAVLELQERMRKIQSYVNRLESQIMKGNLSNMHSVNRLLDSVIHRMDSRPQPPMSFNDVDLVIETQDMDSSVVYGSLQTLQNELDSERHIAMNYLCLLQLSASDNYIAIKSKYNIVNDDDILTMDHSLANHIAQEAIQCGVNLTMIDTVADLAEETDPLMSGDEPFEGQI